MGRAAGWESPARSSPVRRVLHVGFGCALLLGAIVACGKPYDAANAPDFPSESDADVARDAENNPDTSIAMDAANNPDTSIATDASDGAADTGAPLPGTTFAAAQQAADAIAVDATHVYWTAANAIYKCAKTGCVTPTLLVAGVLAAAITLDDTNVYWVKYDAIAGAVGSIAKTGGSPTTLVGGLSLPNSIAVDASGVYFTANSTVRRCTTTGANLVTLAASEPFAAAVAVDANNVYWSQLASGTVRVCTKASCTPGTIISGQNGPQGIASDGTSVFWTSFNNGGSDSVRGCPIGVGCTASPIAAGQQGAVPIAIDGSQLYWGNTTGGSIIRCPKTLGPCLPATVMSGDRLAGMAVDEARIYWTSSYSNRVAWIAKPQ